jgi:RNA 2',3'-cyclic 3'-phosphodiesterase
MHQNFPQQFARDRHRVTLIKRSRQNAAPGCDFAPFHCTIIIARMRLFAAIDLSAEVVGNLEDLLRQLQPAAQISWSPPANLHITTKFIGEWPEDRLPELTEALATLPNREPLAIAVEKLGFFPNPHAPRVFWAGVRAGEGLAQLAGDTETALAPLGIPKEDRAFSPHLTLARIKTAGKQTALLQAVAKLPSLDFGNFLADRFYLYRSKTAPTGSVYTRLAEFPFAK